MTPEICFKLFISKHSKTRNWQKVSIHALTDLLRSDQCF